MTTGSDVGSIYADVDPGNCAPSWSELVPSSGLDATIVFPPINPFDEIRSKIPIPNRPSSWVGRRRGHSFVQRVDWLCSEGDDLMDAPRQAGTDLLMCPSTWSGQGLAAVGAHRG